MQVHLSPSNILFTENTQDIYNISSKSVLLPGIF